jgi:hypothetical protein
MRTSRLCDAQAWRDGIIGSTIRGLVSERRLSAHSEPTRLKIDLRATPSRFDERMQAKKLPRTISLRLVNVSFGQRLPGKCRKTHRVNTLDTL